MRDGEEGDDQNDADDVQATHNGQGSQCGHDELKAAHGQTLCDSKVAVVGNADNHRKEEVEEYKNYITALLETVKFYARISETKKDSVEIFVKYDNEEKLRYYKSIDKVSFLDEYSIQEEEEQEEK